MAIKELSNSLIVPNLQALRLEVVTHKIHTQEPCNQVTKNKQASEQASNQANKENHHSILGKFIFFCVLGIIHSCPLSNYGFDTFYRA